MLLYNQQFRTRLTETNAPEITDLLQQSAVEHLTTFRQFEARDFADSLQTWHGRRARGSAWRCKISPQSAQGV